MHSDQIRTTEASVTAADGTDTAGHRGVADAARSTRSAAGDSRPLEHISVLVIDSWIPAPDRDSASLRIVQLLDVLRNIAGKVTFGVGDSPEWRVSDALQGWPPSLRNSRIRLLDGHAAVESHLDECGHSYDVVILSRLSIARRYMEMVRRQAPQAAVIFDTTDLHYLRGFRGAKVTGSVKMMQSALLAKRDELALIRQADAALVVSTVEQAMLADECPGAPVHVVSNIHTARGPRRRFSERSGIVFIGSFSHHPNIDAMEYFADCVRPLLKERLPDVTVTVIGPHVPDSLRAKSADDFLITGYVPDVEPYFDSCRVSIAPLRYGAGVKGKVLLSMGYGVPVVATSIAAEGIPAADGRDMLIADSAEAFTDSVAELHTNQTLWERVSANGLKIVDQSFSVSAARAALTGVLEGLGVAKRRASGRDRHLSPEPA